MELRSRRKLASEPIVNVCGEKKDSVTNDEKDDSHSNSEDWLIRDGDFESDENSDVEIPSRKRGVVLTDGDANVCSNDYKSRTNVASNKKAKGPGGTSKTIEDDDVMGMGNTDNEGSGGFSSGDGDNSDSPMGEVNEEIQNAPSVDVRQPARKRQRDDKPLLIWEIWETDNEEWVKQNIDEVIDLENHNERVDETAEPSSDLTMPLLRYQKEWLAWAMKQEASETRGGILADEMGMGKTIQAIALVLAKREWSLATSQFTESTLSGQALTGLSQVKGTLVICPVVAVTQWESEITRFTAKGSTKVLIYHGPGRVKSLGQLSEYDFVLTTYALVESEYRRNVMPAKKSCVYCGTLLSQSKMSVHLKYFCGPDAVRTYKQSKQQRKQGKGKKHVENFSPSSTESKRTLKESKINVHQSSSIEAGTSSQQSESKGTSILHSVKWQRIILDEPASRDCTINIAIIYSGSVVLCAYLLRRRNGSFIHACAGSIPSKDDGAEILLGLVVRAAAAADTLRIAIGAIQSSHYAMQRIQEGRAGPHAHDFNQIAARHNSSFQRITRAANNAAQVIAAVERNKGHIPAFHLLQLASKRAILGDELRLPLMRF